MTSTVAPLSPRRAAIILGALKKMMLGVLILAFSIAALGQFVVFYARAVLASVAEQPLAGYVQQIEGFPSRPLQAEDFPHLVQLQRICPQVGPEARGLRLARVYFQALSAVKQVVNGFVPGIHGWAEREQTLCARFAAVLLDQRLARTAAAAADMRSY